MAIPYKGQLNLGNAALGTEKSITANEDIRTAEARDLAREIAHQSHDLIPEKVAEMVLDSFCQACVDLLNMGFGVQLRTNGDVAMRIIPDIHVAGGSINLARARQLDPTVTELTADNAADLIDRAGGVTVKVRAIVQQKFTDLLHANGGGKVERTGIETKAYVERKDGATSGGTTTPGAPASGDDSSEGDDNTGTGSDDLEG